MQPSLRDYIDKEMISTYAGTMIDREKLFWIVEKITEREKRIERVKNYIVAQKEKERLMWVNKEIMEKKSF